MNPYLCLLITINYSEFCGAENVNLDLADEEIPQQSTVDYILAPPDPQLGEKQAKGMLLYCIDVSGSMGSTVHMPQLQCMYIPYCIPVDLRVVSRVLILK